MYTTPPFFYVIAILRVCDSYFTVTILRLELCYRHLTIVWLFCYDFLVMLLVLFDRLTGVLTTRMHEFIGEKWGTSRMR